MPKSTWTISANDVKGGAFGSILAGCRISTNDAETAYEFLNGNNVLSTTTESTLPTGSFSFPSFTLGGPTWNITVTTLQGGASNNEAQGTWNASSGQAIEPTTDESGTWTAQAGGGAGEDDPESAKSTVA